jgi:hypothetical protein
MENKINLDGLYSAAFQGAEASPPESLLGKIFESLDSRSADNLYREAFSGDEVAPPASVWSKIARRLWLAGFISFSYNRLNVYYASGFALAAGLLAGLFLTGGPADNTIEHPVQLLADEQAIIAKPDWALEDAVKPDPALALEEGSNIAADKLPAPALSVQRQPAALPGSVAMHKQSPGNIAHNITLLGETDICQFNAAEYYAEPQVDGARFFVPGLAAEQQGGNTFMWIKAGTHRILYLSAQDSVLAYKTIDVRSAEAALIIGDADFCQGDNTKTLRVSSDADLGITYDWRLARNSFKILANGFISVAANYPGIDTVVMTQFDRNTGCTSQAVKLITVHPKPDARFAVVEWGNMIAELSFAEQELVSDTWLIDGRPEAPVAGIFRFSKEGTYNIARAIADRRNCADTAKVAHTVNNYSLHVPNAFAPKLGVREFKPTGNGIETYRIEIFDTENRLLWHSEELANGCPAKGWDGYLDGKPIKPGAYTYRISAKFINGAEWRGIEKNGEFRKSGLIYLLEQ